MSYPPIMIVDEHDVPIGEASMEEAQAKGLYHRIVRINLEDSAGRLLLQKRSPAVMSPNRWDHSAAGHVDAREDYMQAAERELQEELGIRVKLQEIGSYQSKHVYGDKIFNRFNKVYRAVIDVDTQVTLQPEEVSEVKWLTRDEIKHLMQDAPDQVTDGIVDTMNQFYDV